MVKIFSSLLIVLTISLQIWGQCSINFKETNRQILSNPISYNQFEDIDNDGLKDLIGYYVTAQGSGRPTGYQVHYYKRLSATSFDTTAKTTSLTNVDSFGAFANFGDVNGDAFKDMIVKHYSPSILKTYLNDGSGNFTTAISTDITDEVPWAVTDMNGDGKADLVTSNATINYRLAQPDNTFGAAISVAPVNGTIVRGTGSFGIWLNTKSLIVEDFNNDGLKDIAYNLDGSGSSTLYVLSNNGNLTFNQSPGAAFGSVNTELRAIDLNGDGKKDFVSDHRSNRSGRVAVNNGNNTFTSSFLPFPDFGLNSDSFFNKNYFAGDFDGDGDIDLIFPGPNLNTLMINNGNATFTAQVNKQLPGIDTVENLDGDGKPDGIFLGYSFLDGGYRVSDGVNTYFFYAQNDVIFKKNVCSPIGQTKIIDFNGDGIQDRAFWKPATGYFRYYDFDGPLRTDQTYYQFGLGSLGDVPVPNDYDGDGTTDYAIYRKSNGTWWIVGSSGQNIFGFYFGTAEDKPVPADYDGDGKADIALYRPSNGTWHLWLSATQQYIAAQFGIAEDKPVPTDYDGDGKADIAVFRPSTGAWYALTSGNGSFFAIQYGNSTDKPVPGDYDGDGKSNIAVFRDGVWYVLKSDYSTAGIFWGTTNDVPFFNNTLVNPSVGAYRSSNSTYHIGYTGTSTGSSQPTNNSSSETFVTSVLPQQ